ncbi:sulfatase [Prolixibacteraceae bacterium Z1-6]|uniref:Sulfatase n=1 Tax=Draconibacterium aestuarii TaxID=2998507 RepID=A0A9X3FF21_9BACT|nr:sulfatase [Prolixibacteraceae bacterium Z1-6]
MKKPLVVIILCLFLFACTKEKQPNFVFILVDDLGWADVKCNHPQSFYDTPNIDKLAQSGVRFTNAYAANPVCSPTRAALMTGKHPNRVNITDWIPGNDPKKRQLLGTVDSNELALNEITIAEKLKEKGYKTGFFGKWHLGDTGFFPEDQGFDINIGGHHMGHPPGGYYSPYNNPKLPDGPEGEYLTDRLTNESIQFIQQNKKEPFLLYLAFYTVHTPIQAAQKHIQKYETKRAQLEITEVPHQKEGMGWTKMIQENAAYASMVAAMDENVGRVLQALKEQGLDENTWVIFTSDNGGLSTLYRENAPTSNSPLRAGKGWCYEGGIRAPLIISGPDITEPGKTVDQPAISMDYFTTVLNLAGIEHQNNDGENLLPVLTSSGSLQRDELFWHYPHYHGSAWTPGSALRKGDWKLIVFYEDNRTELYNLATDPGEQTDIAEQNPEKVAELKAILDNKLADTNARFPIPNPDYDPRD